MKRISRSSPMHSSQAGDTIVEVLVAVALVSLVLVSAYGLINRNVQASQETQEQAYAQKLVEQQVELLKSSTLPTQAGCYNTSTFAYATLAFSPSTCAVSNGGATYNLSIEPPAAPATTYTLHAKWDTLSGEKADLTVYYKVAN